MAEGNTSWAALFPPDAIIKIEEKGTDIVQTITTKVTNFSDGGGGKETESIAHFGNAYLVIKKPQEDFEVSFDVDITDTSWGQVMSNDTTAYTGTTGSTIVAKSGGAQNAYKIKMEWKDPDNNGSNMYKIIYYNAFGTTFEKDNAADDRLTGTMTFKISPNSSIGSSQKYEVETSDSGDAGVGSVITGSYSVAESDADTEFGFGTGSMLI